MWWCDDVCNWVQSRTNIFLIRFRFLISDLLFSFIHFYPLDRFHHRMVNSFCRLLFPLFTLPRHCCCFPLSTFPLQWMKIPSDFICHPQKLSWTMMELTLNYVLLLLSYPETFFSTVFCCCNFHYQKMNANNYPGKTFSLPCMKFNFASSNHRFGVIFPRDAKRKLFGKQKLEKRSS